VQNKSFYYVYFYTEAGGGFYEEDFVSANLEYIKRYIQSQLLTSPDLTFRYGIYMDVTRVENGIITDDSINPFTSTTIKITGLDAEFLYNTKKGVLTAKLEKPQKQWLKKFLTNCENDLSAENPLFQDIQIKIDWTATPIKQLSGEHVIDGDTLEMPAVARFGIFHPIRTGSYFAGCSEAEMMTRIEK
jgi:hypothetical protein